VISIVLCNRLSFLTGTWKLAHTPRVFPLVRYLLSLSPRFQPKSPDRKP
jgi:hypothetical protein